MNFLAEERAVELGRYIAQNSCTVREAAKAFCISKSTVHTDVTERLSKIDPDLYDKVRVVLDINKGERHLRGGMATKEKYREKRAALFNAECREQNAELRGTNEKKKACARP